MSRFGQIVLFGALAASLGVAAVRAQTVLGDPRDAAKTFASNCSACHKSPRGLAKSGQVAGFLRQHYTTGPEMSAAMAAYLVSAGSAPEPKKGPATADANSPAAKSKSKKGEQLAAQPHGEESAEAIQHRTLRGKQREAKGHEGTLPQAAAPAPPPATAEAAKQTAALSTPAASSASASPPASSAAAEPPATLDIPMPALPEGPPVDLVESYFSSSPVP